MDPSLSGSSHAPEVNSCAIMVLWRAAGRIFQNLRYKQPGLRAVGLLWRACLKQLGKAPAAHGHLRPRSLVLQCHPAHFPRPSELFSQLNLSSISSIYLTRPDLLCQLETPSPDSPGRCLCHFCPQTNQIEMWMTVPLGLWWKSLSTTEEISTPKSCGRRLQDLGKPRLSKL